MSSDPYLMAGRMAKALVRKFLLSCFIYICSTWYSLLQVSLSTLLLLLIFFIESDDVLCPIKQFTERVKILLGSNSMGIGI